MSGKKNKEKPKATEQAVEEYKIIMVKCYQYYLQLITTI